MDHLSQNCSTHTEGLILSSFEVLQNTSPQHQLESILPKRHGLNSSFLDDLPDGEDEPNQQHSSVSTSSSNTDNCMTHSDHQQPQSCGDDEDDEEEGEGCENRVSEERRVEEPAAGDEMFDIHPDPLSEEGVGHFRGDQSLDALNRSNEEGEGEHSDDSQCRKFRDDDDDGDDDDEEEDDYEEAIKSENRGSAVEAGNILQGNGMPPQLDSLHCPSSAMTDLRAQQHFVQFPTGTLLSPSEGWSSDNCYPAEWHLSLPHTSQDLSNASMSAQATDVLSHTLHRHGTEPNHVGQQQTHNLWGVDADNTSKLMVGHQTWPGSKVQEEDEIDEELEDEEEDEECANVQRLRAMHHHHHRDNVHGEASHWVARQPHQVEIHHPWPKEIGDVFPGGSPMNGPAGLFPAQDSQRPMAGHIASEPSYVDTVQAKGQAGITPWTLRAQLPTGPPIGAIPRHVEMCERICTQQQQPQQLQSAFYCPLSSQACSSTMQVHSPWPHAQAPVHMQPAPSLETHHHGNVVTREHFHTGPMPQHSQGLRFKSQAHVDHPRGYGVRELWKQSKVRSALTQARHLRHPYCIKEEKKLHKDICPASAANLHSVKASHIVSWYIDYLIHENEHLTQISRAFSLPVNLFHSDDFYFMESLKKKVHFPSLKFLTWMQQNLPTVNINAVDFHEGRPPSTTSTPQAQSSSSSASTISGGGLDTGLHSAGNGGSSASVNPVPSCWSGGPHHHSHVHPHHQHQLQHQLHHPHHKQHQHKHQQQQQELGSLQNKSRRDIIHDVFFYFQHRRVTCQN